MKSLRDLDRQAVKCILMGYFVKGGKFLMKAFNINKDLLSLITLLAGMALVIASGVFFLIRRMGLYGDFSDKLFVLLLVGIGVIFIFLSIRIKVKRAESAKDKVRVLAPVLISLIAFLIYALHPHLFVISYIIYASGAFYLIFDIFASVTERIKEISEVEEIEEEKWRPIFTGLSEIEKNITSIFHIHRELRDTHIKTLKDIVDVYVFSTMLKEVPEESKEYVEAFKVKLEEVLERCGIEKWEPRIGDVAPDGCKKRPASGDYPSYPEGTVVKVISPGFRTREGLIIEPPLVEVVT